jgi:1-acyl-sn-glycerol-3-phosphate acyltransferase
MDIPVLLAHVPLEIRFFAKKGLFRIPLLGGHLRRAGHLAVARDNPRASLKSLTEAAKLVRAQGLSVVLFPEGGRAPGAMRAFKEGATYLAIKAGIPVAPVGIIGTRQVLPMQSFHVRPAAVTLRIGEPISTQGMRLDERGALNDTLRCKVLELVGKEK